MQLVTCKRKFHFIDLYKRRFTIIQGMLTLLAQYLRTFQGTNDVSFNVAKKVSNSLINIVDEAHQIQGDKMA